MYVCVCMYVCVSVCRGARVGHFFDLLSNTFPMMSVHTSNKKNFKEMNSYVGMTIVKKEQGQDEYFNQQSILLTLFTSLHTAVSCLLARGKRRA